MNLRPLMLLALSLLLAAALPLGGCQSGQSQAARESSLSAEGKAAYQSLISTEPGAAALAQGAKGVLVFPRVIKGGFIVGAFHGQGVMLQNDQAVGYYDTTGGSYGLQVGLQEYAYALFFMSDEDLNYLTSSKGWEFGAGPSITVVDKGLAGSLTTMTARKGVYCYFFDQKGLMAGLGLQGSKITQIDK